MRDRPKEKRLRRLRLIEENVDPQDLEHFREFLSIDPFESLFQRNKPVSDKISFNLWNCAECQDVIATSDVKMCVICKKTYCEGCGENTGDLFCTLCNAFVCHGCEENVTSSMCDCESTVACGRSILDELPKCEGSKDTPGCLKSWCAGGRERVGSACSKCECTWCKTCSTAVAKMTACSKCKGKTCCGCVEEGNVACFNCNKRTCEACAEQSEDVTICAVCKKSLCDG